MTRYEELRNIIADCKHGFKRFSRYADKIVGIMEEEAGEIAEIYGLNNSIVSELRWHELALLDEMLNGADEGSSYITEQFATWCLNNRPVEIVVDDGLLKCGGYDLALRYDEDRGQWQLLWDYITVQKRPDEDECHDPNEGLWDWSEHIAYSTR